MIVVAGEVDLEPGGREAALAGARPFIEAALAEPGCRHYAWTPDPHRPDRIHVFEEWDTADELQAHLQGEPYLGMLGHLSGHTIVASDTRKYRVTAREPVYTADGAPTARFSDEAGA